ncbi:MAG: c-type cytochrome [Akkermansiaceae bacterium]
MRTNRQILGYIGRLGVAFLLVSLVACGGREEKRNARGFVLPDGDTQKGKQAFIELNCHSCHTVAGEVLPEVERGLKAPHLGGEVYRVKTYGELVTSVINPKHVISKDWDGAATPMPVVNDRMTVQQMIDIVAFLNAHYVKLEPEYEVPYYGP